MAKFIFQVGQPFETLTKPELSEALAAEFDRQTAVTVRGIKNGEMFLNLAQIQQLGLAAPGSAPSVNVLSTPGTAGFTPGNGFVWAVMNIAWEVSAASNVRIYKGAPPGLSNTPTGIARPVFANTGTPQVANSTFSKGQLMMRSGDQLTFVTVTNTAFFLSMFVSYIQCPAERVGELLL